MTEKATNVTNQPTPFIKRLALGGSFSRHDSKSLPRSVYDRSPIFTSRAIIKRGTKPLSDFRICGPRWMGTKIGGRWSTVHW